MQKALEIYNNTNKKLKALSLANYLISWDLETEAPVKANHGEQMATLSEMVYTLSTSEDYKNAIETLFKNRNKLDEVLCHEITVMREENQKLSKIPMDEYIAFNQCINEFYNVYVDAKNNNNWEIAKPYYKKIIDYRKKYVKWLENDKLKGYDILLDEFEKGMTTKEYDNFFNLLKEKLVPLIHKINEKKKSLNEDYPFNNQIFPKDKQKIFQEYIRDVMGFNRDYTVIKESEHPFTTNNTITDVRITNHYFEDNFTSSIFSAIHEMGHGLYELQVAPEIDKTMSGGGASMAMHESQSRFMENMIARSKIFWQTHFEKLKEVFYDQLKDVNENEMFKFVNKVECSLIRTEADELTYNMHILVRYEIEKMIIDGNLSVDEIPEKWNELYKEYLGIDVPSYKDGCMQDVHWACGDFGYFPTYALGSAYSAQIYHAMAKDINIEKEIASGSMKNIEKWLKEHIHKYGSSKESKDILYLATKEHFNPNYYIDYLVNKYSEIYGIDN